MSALERFDAIVIGVGPTETVVASARNRAIVKSFRTGPLPGAEARQVEMGDGRVSLAIRTTACERILAGSRVLRAAGRMPDTLAGSTSPRPAPRPTALASSP
jgi:hypothetical protein